VEKKKKKSLRTGGKRRGGEPKGKGKALQLGGEIWDVKSLGGWLEQAPEDVVKGHYGLQEKAAKNRLKLHH